MTTVNDLFPAATFEDLRLYFNQTLMWARPNGNKDFKLWYICGIDPSADTSVLHLASDMHSAPVPWLATELEIEVKFPETGYMNWRSSAIRLGRKSRRQNQKGLCHNTLYIDNPFGDLLYGAVPGPHFKLMDKYGFCSAKRSGFTGASDGASFISHLQELLTGKEPVSSFGEAWYKLSQVGHPTIARAVGRKFALSKAMQGKIPTLWYDGFPVGSSPSYNSVVVGKGDASMFFQEVADFFQPQGIDVSAE